MSKVQDALAWADFRQAYKRISDARDRRQNTGSESSLARADGLEEALMEMEDAFQHIHVRSDDGDQCALCELDLRNSIHARQ